MFEMMTPIATSSPKSTPLATSQQQQSTSILSTSSLPSPQMPQQKSPFMIVRIMTPPIIPSPCSRSIHFDITSTLQDTSNNEQTASPLKSSRSPSKLPTPSPSPKKIYLTRKRSLSMLPLRQKQKVTITKKKKLSNMQRNLQTDNEG